MTLPAHLRATVRCRTCSKVLGYLRHVPTGDPEERLRAVERVSSQAFCEGHSKNLNLDIVDWSPDSAPEEEEPLPLDVDPDETGHAPTLSPERANGALHA